MSNSAEVLIMIGLVLPRSPVTWRSIRASASACPGSGSRPSAERILALASGDVLSSARASGTEASEVSFACSSRRRASPSRTGRSIHLASRSSASSGGGVNGSGVASAAREAG